MKQAVASFVLLVGLAACAGPGGMSPSGGLMYQVPAAADVVYLTGDTSSIDIDAGDMGSFRVRATSQATVGVSFSQAAGGVQVTATYQELLARVSQPMGGDQSVTEEDIDGDIVFTMDGQGRSTVVSLPGLTEEAESMAEPHAFVYEFFPRLPGGSVGPGDSWTDTISYDAALSSGDMSSNSVITSTLQGDTVVGGMTLLRVTFQGQADVYGSAVQEGMEMAQTAAGDLEGMYLWDPARSVLVFKETTVNLRGTMEVIGAGIPAMPLRVSGTSTVRLQGG
ncbi:hypothetical protein ACFL5A_00715 [Gemmatimonadota bacterium]